MIILFSLLISLASSAPNLDSTLTNNKLAELTYYNNVLENISPSKEYNLLNFPICPIISGNNTIKVNSKYGFRCHPILNKILKHEGMDISATLNDPVLSAGKGIVIVSKKTPLGYGNHVIVKHEDGYYTTYAHLNKILVSEGDTVSLGDKLGLAGRTGLANGVHVHFEIRKNGISLDPMRLLNCKNEEQFINLIYTLNDLYKKYIV